MTTDQKPESAPKSEAVAVREIGSAEIFQGERTVVISHEGVQYRLYITRNNNSFCINEIKKWPKIFVEIGRAMWYKGPLTV